MILFLESTLIPSLESILMLLLETTPASSRRRVFYCTDFRRNQGVTIVLFEFSNNIVLFLELFGPFKSVVL